MKAMEAVRAIMTEKSVRPADLSGRLGIKQNVLSERFTQKNVSIAKLDEMLRVLDYKVILVPRTTRTPDGGYEVE